MKNLPTSNSWVICTSLNPHANLRLFCFPYAGGGSQSFQAWSSNLPLTIEICPVELPGRGALINLTPFTQLLPLVQAIAQTILPHLNKPFVFFGHSMGALISFELARLLSTKYSLYPVHLFVSGHRAPQIPVTERSIHALPEHEFIQELLQLGGTPKAVLENDELMELLLPMLRADFEVVETYTYTQGSPLNCPITAISGSYDNKINYSDLEAWQAQTNASFSRKIFPGDHFFLNSSQSLILEFLGKELQQIANKATL
jgi:medium-chain acyl-[acyl-carrier-protein] hydrolase